uniref:CND05260 n=1 Tax=Kwoniella heveanensis TaxID=89924 RepID=D2KCE3_9TREE|nr:CND05260 [Kwoniella heveanensis]
MLTMMQRNPALTQSSERASIHDVASQLECTYLDLPVHNFTFIPPKPADLYTDLLSRCLDHDLEILKTLPEDEDVSLGILSPEHVSLLGECGTRWRLSAPFRGRLFLNAILDKQIQGEVPTACVHEATVMLQRIQQEWPLSSWATSERTALEEILDRRNLCFLNNIEAGLHTDKGYHSDEFLEAVDDWKMLDRPSTSRGDMKATVDRISNRIKSQAFSSYIEQASERLDLEGSKTGAFALYMATWVEKEAKKLDRKFCNPITSEIDLVPLVLRQQLTLWARDLEDTVQILVAEGADGRLEELFSLYRKASKLADMGEAFMGIDSIHFPWAPLFSPVIHLWLDQTAAKTRGWTEQALTVDKFEPCSPNGPSSSVTDLFDSFRSSVSFMMDLNWPDEHQLAVFATRLAKIISLAINEYCLNIERLFFEDMRRVDTTQTAAKEKAWLEKARSTLASLQGERKIQAFFNFTSESCVKLNNIESARQQLDQLYDQMRVDDLSAYETSAVISKRPQAFLFTVKIVLAEGLFLDGLQKAPDSFVILSDEHGNRYAKTRTIVDDPDPRWDESFDIHVKGDAWFMATIRHRNLSGKHDLLGRAYLRLDPGQYVDLMSKDILLPLDSRGHILLRMTPVLRHTLSRTSIKMVLKPATTRPLDYNEALGKLSAAYRSALGTPEYTIPPTQDEKRRGPSDTDIEAAIHPLLDYLDTNNHTLASTLSLDAMQMVMTKLWKQILMTIEALIVPPLSDKPSRMRALSDGELDVALKWLKFLRDFFYVGGDASGVPLSVLQSAKFSEILSVRIYYDWSTDDLMEECIRGFQSTLKHRALKPSKTLASQRNLGTIRARKSAKKAVPNTAGNTEMIMRILRMRQGTQEFLAQQIQTLSVVKLENPRKGRSLTARGR